jgi:hypothetical protein
VSLFEISNGLGTSLSGYVLSITGLIFPASRNPLKRASDSFLLGIESPDPVAITYAVSIEV